MSEGNIYYAERGGTGVIRFEGAISYTLGSALDRFLDQLFAGGDFHTLLVDLSATESIDSTGLGLLAKLAKLLRRRDGGKPLLFSSRPDINVVLRSICLDDVFVLCEQSTEFDGLEGLAAGSPLPAGDPSAAALARTVLEAHRLLCEMNESNRALFQNVVDAFENDPGLTS